jgi:hypothetical protein
MLGRTIMARPVGTKKKLDIGALITSGVHIAHENAYEYREDIAEEMGLNIVTLKDRLRQSGFTLVQIWAIRKMGDKK